MDQEDTDIIFVKENDKQEKEKKTKEKKKKKKTNNKRKTVDEAAKALCRTILRYEECNLCGKRLKLTSSKKYDIYIYISVGINEIVLFTAVLFFMMFMRMVFISLRKKGFKHQRKFSHLNVVFFSPIQNHVTNND